MPRRLTLLALCASCAGCAAWAGCASPPQSAPPAVALPPPAPAAREAAAPRARDACGRRPRCEEVGRHAAGTSAAGHALFVVELSLGPRAPEDDSGGRGCEQREVWLVQEGRDAPAPRALLEMCNDGYGASGVGEDQLHVEPNRFVHTRLGGSAWRWSTTTTTRLDPPAVVALASSGWWSPSADHDTESHLDLETLQGFVRTEIPRCDAEGRLPAPQDAEQDGRGAFGHQPVPAVPLPAALTIGPIAEAARHDLAGCGARALADPARPEDLGLVAVLDDTTSTLLLQVHDDHVTKGDRIVLWASPRSISHGAHCWSSEKIAPLELDLTGRIVGGAAAYPGVSASAAPGPSSAWRLVRVAFREEPRSLTVRVTDADPGERDVAIATADTHGRGGELVALGGVWPLDATRVSCVIEGARLVTRLPAPPEDPRVPLLGEGF